MRSYTFFISDDQLIFFAANIVTHRHAIEFLIFTVKLQPLVRRNRYSINGQE